MAASMLRRLKDDGFEISAIHADNDSTTAARLKAEFQSLEKRCDKNHLKKNITKQLYSLSKSHKQLKQEGVICYITKCYMHPLSIKRQSEEEVGRKLDMVVPHIFGDHNLCSTSWCAYHRNPKSYRLVVDLVSSLILQCTFGAYIKQFVLSFNTQSDKNEWQICLYIRMIY